MVDYSITDLASEFDISTRTIRYYEERGFLYPCRTENGQRLFSKKDRTTLKLILRGKRFGFSLDEIKEMIDLFEKDPSGQKQLERTISYGHQKVKELSKRIEELVSLKEEMEGLLCDFEKRLAKENQHGHSEVSRD